MPIDRRLYSVALLAGVLSCRAPEVAPAQATTESEHEDWTNFFPVLHADPTPARTPAESEARLLSTNFFRTANISLGGDWPPHHVRAFNTILDSPGATDSIERLVSSPNAVARFYGACGLYFVARERFLPELEKLRALEGDVLIQDGCVIYEVTCSQLVDLILARSMPEQHRSAAQATAISNSADEMDDDATPQRDAVSGK